MNCMKTTQCIPVMVLFFLCTCTLVCYAKKPAQTIAGLPVVNNVPLPESASLCGEPVPLERQAVRERLDREFTVLVWDRPQVFLWLKRANRYFPYIEEQLKKAGLPDDLKYLAVAESSLLTHALSSAGAGGYWQFMPKTAKQKGLQKNSLLDERYSLEHATAAALAYLKECHAMFGSWSLAMAAYNCGERRVQQAIATQKTNDYYQLKLPAETERYVYRIAAIKILLENHAQYGYSIEQQDLYPPAEYDALELNSPYELQIADIAKAAGTDYKTIRDLNPQLKNYYFPAGKYTIKVPAGLGEKFSSEVARSSADAAKRARSQKAYYIVKRGDTLGHIAQRTGVPIKKIQLLNNLRGSTIYPGQKLRLRP